MRFEILDAELAELHVSAEERRGAEPLLLHAEPKDDTNRRPNHGLSK